MLALVRLVSSENTDIVKIIFAMHNHRRCEVSEVNFWIRIVDVPGECGDLKY